jgi:hypothetical protein
MQVSDILNELKLGNSVAESDERLDKYFINTPTFNALVTGRRDIIAGDKGTGKTALYRILVKRASTIPSLRSTKVLTAFNLTGSPIFAQLTNVPQQSEGQYIAFWKTYFLSLIANWLIDQPHIVRHSNIKRIQYFLEMTGLKTVDTTPKGIFSKLLSLFPRTSVRSAEVDFSINESGLPHVKPKLEFADAQKSPSATFFGIDYSAGFIMLEAILRESNLTIWIALDRLDEAFQGYVNVEIPALRALLRTHLDMQEVSNIHLKLFLRKDLFRKIIFGGFGGFVNLTHVNDRKIEIVWEDEDLKYLLIARIKDNESLMRQLKLHRLDDDKVFARIFPDKVSQGKKQSMTWKWMLSRIADGNSIVAPRNLIDLVEKSREAQLRAENRVPREYMVDKPLIESDSVKQAYRLLSRARVEDTLLAEAADLITYLEKFRNKKAEQNVDSLKALFKMNDEEVDVVIRKLREIGFLREVGSTYKVPILYREGLGITQGKANGGDGI